MAVKSPSFHSFKFMSTGACRFILEMDGKPLQHVLAVKVEANAGELPVVTVQFAAIDVDVDTLGIGQDPIG